MPLRVDGEAVRIEGGYRLVGHASALPWIAGAVVAAAGAFLLGRRSRLVLALVMLATSASGADRRLG